MMLVQRFLFVCPTFLPITKFNKAVLIALFIVFSAASALSQTGQTSMPLPRIHAEVSLILSSPPPLDEKLLQLPGGEKQTIPISIDGTPEPLAEAAKSERADEVVPIVSGVDEPLGRGPYVQEIEQQGVNWNRTFLQSLFFLGVMHGYRLWYEPDTRAALKGPFFKDYFRSVKHLRGWSDGDSFLTNYIGHPMMGATAGRIQIHNDSQGRRLEPRLNRDYLRSRLKAFGYSTLFSLQFEVGLISEGAIGNAMPNKYSQHPFSYADIVITPTLGTGWLVGEDFLDKYLVQYIEHSTNNRFARAFARGFLNPTRGMANLMRLKWPWYRDDRPL